MRVFVTGATGVLGRPVVSKLLGRGAEVSALSRSGLNHEIISELGATPVEADLYDPASLAPHLDGCSAILHLATSIPPVSKLRAADAWKSNDRIRDAGTRALVEAAGNTGSVQAFIYPSVCFMYGGGGDRWLTAENAEIRAPGPLQSTLTAERHVAGFATADDERRGVVLRFGAFYGPASRDSRDMLNMARRGVVLPLAAQSVYKPFIWIDDAAAAILAALERAETGIYDVVEDTPFTQRQAHLALARALGRKTLWRLPRWMLRFALTPEMRELAGRSQRVSAKRFKDATGWRPQVPDQSDGWVRIVREASGA